jgi:hypothetical protein
MPIICKIKNASFEIHGAVTVCGGLGALYISLFKIKPDEEISSSSRSIVRLRMLQILFMSAL